MRLMRRRSARDLEDEIPKLRRFARMVTRGDHAEADDLVQETLVRALGALDRFREGAELGTWLTSILLNVHRSAHRKRVRQRDYAATMQGPEPSESGRQDQKLEVEQTLAALDALPEEQRLAITLVAVKEMSYAEAAKALGVKLGTLMSRISRGRATMRKAVDGPGDAEKEGTDHDAGRTDAGDHRSRTVRLL